MLADNQESHATADDLVHSESDVVDGEGYTVFVGGTPAGSTVGGLALGGSTSGAKELGTVTAGQAPAGRGH